MLVLGRNVGQTIHLTGGISIKLLQASRNAVKVGITAPPHIGIVRDDETRLRERMASGEPLHSIEARHDLEEACRPFERDMMARPVAMQAQLAGLVAENTRLREELAEVRAKLQGREFVK